MGRRLAPKNDLVREASSVLVSEAKRYGQTGGAAAELVACAAFMLLRWWVYRAQQPNAPYDLVVDFGTGPKRVEVKGLSRHVQNGVLRCSFATPRNQEYDLLAVVDIYGDHRVWLFGSSVSYLECMDAIRCDLGLPVNR